MLRTFNSSRGFLKDHRLRILFVAMLSSLSTGTIVYHFVEGWSFLDSFYFSAITLTTVGYGDFSPQTPIGKLFTVFYIMAGIGMIFGFINAFFDFRNEKMQEANQKKKNTDS